MAGEEEEENTHIQGQEFDVALGALNIISALQAADQESDYEYGEPSGKPFASTSRQSVEVLGSMCWSQSQL